MASRRRGDLNPKLHMDRQPTIARITDPSLPAGKRREIDNVMKKARANTNDYWDKKLLEAEEKDPNRWRHTGFKKMYIQGESSSGESDREGGYRYNSASAGAPSGRSRSPRSRSHSCLRKSPPLSPAMRRRSPPHCGMDNLGRRISPPSSLEGLSRGRPCSPPPSDLGRRPLGGISGKVRPRSPDPPLRRKLSRSPLGRRRSPPIGSSMPTSSRWRSPPENSLPQNKRGQIHPLPRSKRPPSPPPRNSCRSRSNSSVTSCSGDSCSVCSPKHRHRSRSNSPPRVRVSGGPRSPPPKSMRSMQYRNGPPPGNHSSSRIHARPPPSPAPRRSVEKFRENKARRISRERSFGGTSLDGHIKGPRSARHSPPEDPRLKTRPPEPPEPPSTSLSTSAPQKKKEEGQRATHSH